MGSISQINLSPHKMTLQHIHSLQDCLILQEDLTSLGQWEANWQMKFNVAKCHSMRVTQYQHHKQILFDYSLHNWKMFSLQIPLCHHH